MTEFAFGKIEIQIELAKKVEFSLINRNEGIVENKNKDKVSSAGCTCMFFSSMNLPCRHILKFFMSNEVDSFVPEMCAMRWSKYYYQNSHPALSSHIQISNTKPIYVQSIDKSLIDQYKKSNAITKEIRSLAMNFPPEEQTFYFDKLQNLRKEMLNSSNSQIGVQYDDVQNRSAVEHVQETPLNLCTNYQLPQGIDDDESPMNREFKLTEEEGKSTAPRINKESTQTSSTQRNNQSELSVFKQSQQLSISSSIENIKVPEKVNSVGRPKRKAKTAIGINRQTKKKLRSNK